MAQTVIVHHPDKPGSTIRVTLKAFRAGYAADGYVEGVREGDSAPAAGRQVESELVRVQAQLAEAQQRLRDAQAEADAAKVPAAAAPSAPAAPPRTANPPTRATPPAAKPPATAAPAKAAPRKRAPRKRTRPAAAPATPAAEQLSPGPADIDSKPALD